MQTIENVVIAAAGMGKRLGMGKPKALVEVCGKKIIEYQLELLRDVPNVFMVVGFCDQMVMEAVKEIRSDVIFVRNPDFKHTKTLESFFLASQIIHGNGIFMDGDMIVRADDFQNFLNQASKHPEKMQIAVSKRISDDPVYTIVDEDENAIRFSTTECSPYEWANIVSLPTELLRGGKENVYEFLAQYLPCGIACIDRLEIDTPEDLENAEQILRAGDF